MKRHRHRGVETQTDPHIETQSDSKENDIAGYFSLAVGTNCLMHPCLIQRDSETPRQIQRHRHAFKEALKHRYRNRHEALKHRDTEIERRGG